MKNLFFACIALATGLPVAAETILFEHDTEVLIVRGRDSAGDARYEFLSNGEDRLQCVALNKDGQPMAVENTYAHIGIIRFDDLSVDEIAKVICQKRN